MFRFLLVSNEFCKVTSQKKPVSFVSAFSGGELCRQRHLPSLVEEVELAYVYYSVKFQENKSNLKLNSRPFQQFSLKSSERSL